MNKRHWSAASGRVVEAFAPSGLARRQARAARVRGETRQQVQVGSS